MPKTGGKGSKIAMDAAVIHAPPAPKAISSREPPKAPPLKKEDDGKRK